MSTVIDGSGVTTAAAGPAASQRHTLPAVSADTVALLAASQTLTNKTLTSPRIGTSILDSNGNTALGITATASAVNYLQLVNAAAGGYPRLDATGSDADISATLRPKGTGSAGLEDPSGNARIMANATGIGFFGVTPAARPAALTQTYATADRTHANPTSSDLSGITSSTTGSALAEPSAAYAQAEMQQNFRRIQDQFVNLRADLLDLKQFVNSIADDLQTLGLEQ